MIEHIEVDGIPAVFAKRSGPLSAGLTFRVGCADETLSRAGITHMVEHLALHRFGLTDYHVNGATGVVYTHFEVQGSESDVASFLTGVCDSLADLPVDRLDTEKAILRTEAAGRARGVREQLSLWRYGAQGYGLLSYPEWGVGHLRAEDVRHWAQTWFTRDNAVLWLAGDGVPSGLRLRLPAGTRRPVPAHRSLLRETPAYFASGDGKVLLDTVVRRSTAASVFSKVLERQLFRSLRQEGGYSYTAATSYAPRGDGFATITALADALPDKQDAVVGGVVDVLAQMKVGRIDQQDIDAVRAQSEAAMSDPDADVPRLPEHAANLLTGQPSQTIDELRTELRAITGGDIHAVAVGAIDSALLQVPRGRSADWAGFAQAPTHSSASVIGTRYACREDQEVSLVVGADGASLDTPAGPITVRFTECAGLLRWPDGARRLIGTDGLAVHIEPTLYNIDHNLLAAIDAAVNPSTVIHLPTRSAEAIPQPSVATPSRRAAAPTAARTRGETVTFVVLSVIASLWGCLALLTTAGMIMEPAAADGWIAVGVIWLIEFLLLLPVIRIVRRRRITQH